MSKEEEELRAVFAKMYPFTPKHHLPWAACQIPDFIRARIEHEVKIETREVTNHIVRILAEASPPKHHVSDMVRYVVDLAKKALTQWKKAPPLNARVILFHPQSGRQGCGMAVSDTVCRFDKHDDSPTDFSRSECLWMHIPGYSGEEVR